ncbi:hypothetical protein [Hymenobacter sp. HSC-4F20]|uniref:hypothetical protein n=1 Tax=Hymenobacter sp. HSC-4F20 TaxID=2864135 RepID=UPI001C73B09A|nr:hypothetical protein [Hymenobacter sp. HSC-4F20]
MRTYRSFHDSCLKEVAVQNREYVDERQAMHFDNQTIIKMRFQSQFKDNAVLEWVFEDVIEFNWVQDERNVDTGLSIILQAVCQWQQEMLYWAEDIDWHLDAADKNDYRWVAAKRGRWRIVEKGLGPATALFAAS